MSFRKVAATAAASLMLAALTACGGDDDSNGSDSGAPDKIILGLVPSQEVDQLVEDAEILGEMLSDEIGIPVETFVPTDYAGLVTAIGTGKADIGMFGPIALVQAADESGANVVLQSIRFGSPTYHTQWFTNEPDRFCQTDVVEVETEDGNTYNYCNGTDTAEAGPVGEEALAEIESGETIQFVDASSASGYYYPATQLGENTDLDPLTDVDAQFAGDHTNAILAVQRGDAAVGVSYDDARDDLVEENPKIGEEITVFAWSTEIPNDGVALRGDLPQDVQDDITAAFKKIMETEEGAAAFDAVYSIEGLVDADLDALDEARTVAANFGDS